MTLRERLATLRDGRVAIAAAALWAVFDALVHVAVDMVEPPRIAGNLATIGAAAVAVSVVRFFERFGKTQSDTPAALNLLSTHPSNETRARLAEEVGTAGAPVMSESDWLALQEICGAEPESAEEAEEEAP